ncbi:MAG: 30S ribosomal protein S5 [Candidatus Micrarchaeaceae archaeon]
MNFKTNYREERTFNINEWEPRTELGREVKEHKVTTIEEIFHAGRHIEESEIVDALLPGISFEIIEITSVQRMTKNNRKQKYRAIAVVGDRNGHVGVGAAKDVEVKAAMGSAITDAKMNIMPIVLGCGSWQCMCGTKHSLPFTVSGKSGSVEVTLKPAPRGLGIVASKPVKKMLELAGIKDIWTFSKGRTRAKYNVLIAVQRALTKLNGMKNIAESVKE